MIPTTPSLLQTVDRTLRLLTAFPKDRAEVSLSELSAVTGIGPSMVHRMLYTLQRHGFVSQAPASRRYSLGLRLFELGRLVADNLEIRQKALPIMRRVSEQTGESVVLMVHSDGEAVCVEGVENQQSQFRYNAPVGQRYPLHAGAGGKVLLAFQSAETIEAILRRPLPRYTDRTVTDPDHLRAELAEIRKLGYAVNHGAVTVGVTAIGAPIKDHTGAVAAAMTLVGPAFLLTADRALALTPVVVDAARGISHELGHSASAAAGAGL